MKKHYYLSNNFKVRMSAVMESLWDFIESKVLEENDMIFLSEIRVMFDNGEGVKIVYEKEESK